MTDSGGYLFWRTDLGDSDRWTAVVNDADSDDWLEFPGGLVEFLHAVISGAIVVPLFPDWPLVESGRWFSSYSPPG
jgi:hypothetical protein